MSVMTRTHPHRRADDRGLTLVELIVASSLLSLVLVVVGGMFVSLVNAERTVTPQSQGTTAAQLTATSIGSGIRNSSEFRITNVGSDQLLVARVAGNDDAIAWSCRAWYYSAAGDGEIRTTTTADGSAIAAPSTSQLATWTQLIEGVSPPTGLSVFTAAGAALVVSFDADAGDSPSVAIRFTAASLTSVGEELTCF